MQCLFICNVDVGFNVKKIDRIFRKFINNIGIFIISNNCTNNTNVAKHYKIKNGVHRNVCIVFDKINIYHYTLTYFYRNETIFEILNPVLWFSKIC